MHIKVDAQRIIQDVHIEAWDLSGMEDEMASSLKSFIGRQEQEFFVHAFKQSLFRYTKMLYSSREGAPPLMLWANSALDEDEQEVTYDMVARIFKPAGARYASFIFKPEHLDGAYYFATEDITSSIFMNLNLTTEVIEIPTYDPAIFKIIAKLKIFNLIRNARNEVAYLETQTGEVKQRKGLSEEYIIGRTSSECLLAIPATRLLEWPAESIEQLISVRPVVNYDGTVGENAQAAIDYVKKIARGEKGEQESAPEDEHTSVTVCIPWLMSLRLDWSNVATRGPDGTVRVFTESGFRRTTRESQGVAPENGVQISDQEAFEVTGAVYVDVNEEGDLVLPQFLDVHLGNTDGTYTFSMQDDFLEIRRERNHRCYYTRWQCIQCAPTEITVAGERIDVRSMPEIASMYFTDPENAKQQIQSIAERWHEGNIGMAMVALESDMEHDLTPGKWIEYGRNHPS